MMIKISYKRFLVFFVVMSIIAEISNGFIIQLGLSDNGVVGYLYRTIYLTLAIVVISKSRQNLKRTMYCVLFYIFAHIIHVAFFESGNNEIISIIKNAVFPCSIFASEVLFNHGKIKEKTVEECIIYSGIVCVLSLLGAQALGIGAKTYEGVTGYKGLFNSVNTITFVLLILSSLTFILAKKSRKIYLFMLLILEITCIALIGTKSGIVMVVIFGFLVELSETFVKKNIKFRISAKTIFFGILIIVCFNIFITIFGSDFSKIINRHVEFMGRSDSVYSFMLSGRNSLLKVVMSKNAGNFSIVTFLFGIGENGVWGYIGKSLEMDLFDFYFAWGIGGVLATYGLSLWYVFYIKKQRNYDKEQTRLLWITYFVSTVYSIFGGHMYGEPFSATFFVLALNCPIMLKNEKHFVRKRNE